LHKAVGLIIATATAAGLVLLPGCASAPVAPSPAPSPAPVAELQPTTAPANANDIVALVEGIPITRGQLEKPLLESYGLQMLLNMMQLTLAKEQLARAHLAITPQDIQQEHERTLAQMFGDAPKSDYDALLAQFLQRQHISRDEFDMQIDTNAYLRIFAEPQLAGKLTDDRVRQAFSQLYGENRVVHDIELTNVLEAAEAKRRMAAGESFEQVAREMSLDKQTSGIGGELPPFSAQSPNVPQVIRDAAFALKINEVSETLAVGDTTHLIKLAKIIPPKIVKYEDVKDSVREELSEQWIQLGVKTLRNQLAEVALQTMKIQDPVLNEQWRERLEAQSAKIHDRDSALQELNRERQNATTNTTPTNGAGPLPERPPATMPGASSPGGPAASTTKP
jgi:hypothetical protein